ncbi:MAG: HAD family phosphatase [Actinomycetota bacterium]|nr:HAD family phosphatase [Actinomycetota bacterium]
MATEPAVLLDLDGTLVDSVFFHVIAWDEALREHGYDVPLWRIHASIGMGSFRLIPWLLGRQVEEAEDISAMHRQRFLDRVEHLRPTNGAGELLHDLEVRKVPFLVSTSAPSDVRQALLDVLDRHDLETTDAGDVPSAKPAPHLLRQSAAELGVEIAQATLVGDSPWDAEAARRIGLRTVAVRCGGFGDERLRAAGAYDVVDDPRALIGRL